MIKFLLSLTLIISMSFSFLAQEGDTEWSTLEHDNYSIEYPSAWELNETGIMGTAFIMLSPVESSDDQFRANVNLTMQDLTDFNLDLDGFIELSENQMQNFITDYKPISSERMTENGAEFHKIICSGKQGILNLTFEQYYWVIDNQAYVLTLTTEQDEYKDLKALGEKILDSFKFN